MFYIIINVALDVVLMVPSTLMNSTMYIGMTEIIDLMTTTATPVDLNEI
jgi:hypothetical protein